MIWRFPFQKLQHQDVGEGAAPFSGLLHFTLDPYLIMLSTICVCVCVCVDGLLLSVPISHHCWVVLFTVPSVRTKWLNPSFSRSIIILGYCISREIKPDPERLCALKELPPPENSKLAKRILDKFAYYTKWIHNFSDKIRPLVENTKFTLETKALKAFKQIKQELEVSALKPIDKSLPFEVECDASDVAISVLAGWPTLVCPFVWVHGGILFMGSFNP